MLLQLPREKWSYPQISSCHYVVIYEFYPSDVILCHPVYEIFVAKSDYLILFVVLNLGVAFWTPFLYNSIHQEREIFSESRNDNIAELFWFIMQPDNNMPYLPRNDNIAELFWFIMQPDNNMPYLQNGPKLKMQVRENSRNTCIKKNYSLATARTKWNILCERAQVSYHEKLNLSRLSCGTIILQLILDSCDRAKKLLLPLHV